MCGRCFKRFSAQSRKVCFQKFFLTYQRMLMEYHTVTVILPSLKGSQGDVTSSSKFNRLR